MLDRLEDRLRLAEIDFAPLYERAVRLPPLAPDALLPDDDVLTRGDGHWHRQRSARAA